jgi:hypothetical protein
MIVLPQLYEQLQTFIFFKGVSMSFSLNFDKTTISLPEFSSKKKVPSKSYSLNFTKTIISLPEFSSKNKGPSIPPRHNSRTDVAVNEKALNILKNDGDNAKSLRS